MMFAKHTGRRGCYKEKTTSMGESLAASNLKDQENNEILARAVQLLSVFNKNIREKCRSKQSRKKRQNLVALSEF